LFVECKNGAHHFSQWVVLKVFVFIWPQAVDREPLAFLIHIFSFLDDCEHRMRARLERRCAVRVQKPNVARRRAKRLLHLSYVMKQSQEGM
jgi:hypothetical protein